MPKQKIKEEILSSVSLGEMFRAEDNFVETIESEPKKVRLVISKEDLALIRLVIMDRIKSINLLLDREQEFLDASLKPPHELASLLMVEKGIRAGLIKLNGRLKP